MVPVGTPTAEEFPLEAIHDVELTRFDPFSDIEGSNKEEENNSSSLESYVVESGTTLIPYGEKSEKSPSGE